MRVWCDVLLRVRRSGAAYICIALCLLFECVTASLIFGLRSRLGRFFVDNDDVVALVSKIACAAPFQHPWSLVFWCADTPKQLVLPGPASLSFRRHSSRCTDLRTQPKQRCAVESVGAVLGPQSRSTWGQSLGRLGPDPSS